MRRTTFISGASSGIGEGMARVLAEKGGHLALAARRTDRLEALRSELLAAYPGIEVSVHALDVNDHDRSSRWSARRRPSTAASTG